MHLGDTTVSRNMPVVGEGWSTYNWAMYVAVRPPTMRSSRHRPLPRKGPRSGQARPRGPARGQGISVGCQSTEILAASGAPLAARPPSPALPRADRAPARAPSGTSRVGSHNAAVELAWGGRGPCCPAGSARGAARAPRRAPLARRRRAKSAARISAGCQPALIWRDFWRPRRGFWRPRRGFWRPRRDFWRPRRVFSCPRRDF